MKKISVFILFFTILVTNLCFYNIANANNFVKCSAESMVTIEADSGRILYEKDRDKKLPMASTTKILTAIVAIENTKDFDVKFSIPKEAVGIEGSSIYLKEGEKLSMRELLYGLMLRSGNDSAVAIAIITAGSVENFVLMMNEFCENKGLKNTHIVTVNGLHDDNHYTTASDLAEITRYALKNQLFSEIVNTKEIVIASDKDKVNKCRLLKNKNKFLKNYKWANGVKTGYTKKAGRCFVGSATKNGMTVICVVLNCKAMFEETEYYIDKAFCEFKNVKLLSEGELLHLNPKNKKVQSVSFINKKDIYYPLKNEEVSKIRANLVYNDENYENARLDFKIENDLIFSEKIYTILVYNKSDIKSNIEKIIKAF